MKREIQFRAKRLNNGHWMYGYVLQSERYTDIWSAKEGFDRAEVDPNTVGQFIGLIDKDGQPIYEGDIVDCDYIVYDPWDDSEGVLEPMRCVVVYEVTEFRFKKEEDMSYQFYDVTNLKVVGNIYDNPEMLKGGQS